MYFVQIFNAWSTTICIGCRWKKGSWFELASTNVNSSVGMLPCVQRKKQTTKRESILNNSSFSFQWVLFSQMKKNNHSFCAPIIDLQNWKTYTLQMAIFAKPLKDNELANCVTYLPWKIKGNLANGVYVKLRSTIGELSRRRTIEYIHDRWLARIKIVTKGMK